MEREDKIKRIIDIANEEFNNYGYSEEFNKIQNLVIEKFLQNVGTNCALLLSFYLNVKAADKERIINTVINQSNITVICNFAINVNDSNYSKLEEAVVKSGQIYFVRALAKCPHARKEYLENVIKNMAKNMEENYNTVNNLLKEF